ncbi:MAG TPA: TonB-dependent receptor [Telluria sp.]|jgi:iron complex outermembrane receptor protein
MMKPTVLSLSLKAMFAAGAVMSISAIAQEAAPTMQRVEITGSSIKRLQAETATPLSVIKAEEFVKAGVTNVQEALSRIPANQSGMGAGNAVGGNYSGLPTGGMASADLRGLGGDKTLVLLNGRRLANHPYDGAAVDLNMIPISALDRVEVLRDGASAIYGTDAIGGVVNFITKRSINKTTITGEILRPKLDGGDEERLNLSSGFGNLDTDGYNIFGVVDWHKQESIGSQQREFSKTGYDLAKGLNATSGTTFPANYLDTGTKTTGNPSFATGCNPPYSFPNPAAGATTCRQDYTRQVDDNPDQKKLSAFVRGAFKVGDGHLATIELLHATNEVISRTAPPPQTGLIMPSTSPYYPAAASGADLSVNWRPLEAGQRTILSKGKADRLVAALEGNAAGWDYKGGLNYSVSKSAENFIGGYVQDASFAAGVANGILNPFALQNAAGAAYLASTALRGEVQNAEVKNTGFDFKASRDIMAMAGGQMAIAFGAEVRRETADFYVNRDIAGQAASSGLSGSLSTSGSRNIQAVFTEVVMPVTKELEVQLAGRFDRYSDVGNTTNPKIGIRYQPSSALLIRGSASTGFRAPTLFEKNSPPSKNDTSNAYNDPVLCPGGVVSSNPIANELRDCDLQQFKLQGGNANLSPEKSKSFSFGFVVEPVSAVTFTADYWNIKLKDKIDALPEEIIYGDYAKYQARFLRNPDGTPFAISDFKENLGEVETDGIDVSAVWRLPKSEMGAFTLGMDGTWLHSYKYQNEKGGAFDENVGRFGATYAKFRWQHTLSLGWKQGPWGATLTNSYKTGYRDQGGTRDVDAYSLWNITGSWEGIKGLSLMAGVKNLLDEEPPLTIQSTLFQQGYDARYTDPVGRALYLRASYSF